MAKLTAVALGGTQNKKDSVLKSEEESIAIKRQIANHIYSIIEYSHLLEMAPTVLNESANGGF